MCVVAFVQTDLTMDPQLQQRGAVGPVFGKPPPSAAPSQQQQIIAATRFWQTDFEPIPEDDLVMLWTRPRTTPNTRQRWPHNYNWQCTKSSWGYSIRTADFRQIHLAYSKKKNFRGMNEKKLFSFFFFNCTILCLLLLSFDLYVPLHRFQSQSTIPIVATYRDNNSVLYLNLNYN